MTYRNLTVVGALAAGVLGGAAAFGGDDESPRAKGPGANGPVASGESAGPVRAQAQARLVEVPGRDGVFALTTATSGNVRVQGTCELTEPGPPKGDAPADCEITWVLPDGSVTAQGEVLLQSRETSMLEVTGGGGRLGDASGEASVTPLAGSVARLSLELEGGN